MVDQSFFKTRARLPLCHLGARAVRRTSTSSFQSLRKILLRADDSNLSSLGVKSIASEKRGGLKCTCALRNSGDSWFFTCAQKQTGGREGAFWGS